MDRTVRRAVRGCAKLCHAAPGPVQVNGTRSEKNRGLRSTLSFPQGKKNGGAEAPPSGYRTEAQRQLKVSLVMFLYQLIPYTASRLRPSSERSAAEMPPEPATSPMAPSAPIVYTPATEMP